MTDFIPSEPGQLPQDKDEWRLLAKKTRQTLDLSVLSQQIQQHIVQWPAYTQSTGILLYHPLPGELNFLALASISEHFAAPHPQFYLPRISDHRQLTVHAWQPGDPLQTTNPFGVSEPLPEAPQLLDLTELDLILVPALAVDHQGNRLGYGQGYYDRLLASAPLQHKTLCAVPAACWVERLPADLTDVPIQWVATEHGLTQTGP
ncbi:MAG: 5-formyltetrahydrofolate cyclo-ligase [Cyanobacteria bacterium HKST-UBA04]|nr:5-formyltetrahydrofolate cyclo-ligase [Cyanobacteria bacterium HKST-UBA04]